MLLKLHFYILCIVALLSLQAYAATVPDTPSPPPLKQSAGPPATPAPNRYPSPVPGVVRPVFPPHTRTLAIPRLDVAPTLVDFLSSPIGKAAAQMLRVQRFIERFPEDGNKPAEQTTAYLGYTHDYFYAAFVCQENNPKLVRAHMLARDSLRDDDNVQLFLDTFHDQRRAFVFQSNPLGIQADALYSEQTGYDFSFDTVWDTWGKLTKSGYVVLMRIPFASLYFAKADPGQSRTWGIILSRNVAHTNEADYWPRSNHNIAGNLTQDIEVEGFRDIAHSRNQQFEPYSLARNLRQLNTINSIDPYFQAKHLQGYAGLDSKFILHNSLVLDTTLNPDFSQVGINNPAAPNQRFPAYFPEVRPFFIENSSYFLTPFNLYYTDNILMPQFGARLTGKLGPWALGVLAVDDRGPGLSVPPGQFGYNTRAYNYATRVNRDVGPLSNVGLIYVDREYIGSFNRVGGLDYRARVKDRFTFTGQAVTSQTKNLSTSPAGEQACESTSLVCSGQAYYDQASYTDLHHNAWLAYSDTSAGYVTDTGYFQRPDVREPNGFVSYMFRPAHGPLLEHGPNFYSERIWDHHGVPLDFYFNPSYNFNFKARTYFSVNFSMGQDRLRPIDYSTLTSDVEYHSYTSGFNFNTSPVPNLAIGGGFYSGTVINYSPPSNDSPTPVNVSSPHVNVEVKPFHHFDLQNNYAYTHFTNPSNGNPVYDNHQLISRWNYQMTKAISFNLIGQYLATLPTALYTSATNSKNLFADALLAYMPHPGTAFYIGYIGNFANINRDLCVWQSIGVCNSNDPILPPTGSSLMNDNKTIYVKLSYLLRF